MSLSKRDLVEKFGDKFSFDFQMYARKFQFTAWKASRTVAQRIRTDIFIRACIIRNKFTAKREVVELQTVYWRSRLLPNGAIHSSIRSTSVHEMRAVSTHKNFWHVHHEQHQHEIDPVVFEPAQRLSPTHFQSLLQCSVTAFIDIGDENKLREPQLKVIVNRLTFLLPKVKYSR